MEPIPVMRESFSEVQDSARTFILKVYMWMTAGLFLTGIISIAPILILGEEKYYELLSENIIFIYMLMGVELLIVFGLSFLINKIPSIVAFFAFVIYASLNGITLSPIFLIYTGASIFSTFFICSAMFGALSVLGFVIKMDLTKFGSFLIMALVGLIIASVVNLFLGSSMLDWIISFVGVAIFVGLTVYDTQKLKNMAGSVDSSSEDGKKASVMGALTLYLDFINLFLLLLRLLGRRN